MDHVIFFFNETDITLQGVHVCMLVCAHT